MQNHRNVLGGVLRSMEADKGGQFQRSGGQVDGSSWAQWRRGGGGEACHPWASGPSCSPGRWALSL